MDIQFFGSPFLRRKALNIWSTHQQNVGKSYSWDGCAGRWPYIRHWCGNALNRVHTSGRSVVGIMVIWIVVRWLATNALSGADAWYIAPWWRHLPVLACLIAGSTYWECVRTGVANKPTENFYSFNLSHVIRQHLCWLSKVIWTDRLSFGNWSHLVMAGESFVA